MKLLDTDTCIALLRGHQEVVQRRSITSDEVATTWINVGELYYAAARSRAPEPNRALVTSFVATLPVLTLDELSVQIFGEAKALLERTGHALADADVFVAAIAVARRAAIVTTRRGHYERVPGVLVESWITGS